MNKKKTAFFTASFIVISLLSILFLSSGVMDLSEFSSKNSSSNLTYKNDTKTVSLTNITNSDEKFEDIRLTSNSESCSNDCYAIKNITLYKNNTPLIDEIRFLTKVGENEWKIQPIRNYNFYLIKSEINELSKKSKEIKTRYEEGTKMEEGNYTIRLEGDKKPSRIVDWQIKSQGMWIDKWAIWGNISSGDDGEVFLGVPSNNEIWDITKGKFNCTANVTDGSTISNITLWTNQSGTWQIENSTDLTYSTQVNITYDTTTYSTGLSRWQNLITFNSFGSYNISQISFEYRQTNVGRDGYIRFQYIFDNNSIAYTPQRTVSSTSWTGYTETSFIRGDLVDTVIVQGGSDGEGFVEIKNIKIFKYTGNTFNLITFNNTISEPTLWSCQACDSDGGCGFALENRTIVYETNNPSLLINEPTGTYSSITGIPINITANDTYGLDSCIFWIMRGASIEVANTTIPYCNYTTFNVASDANYIAHVWINDTSGNINTTNSSFTISTSSPVSPGGGGGVTVVGGEADWTMEASGRGANYQVNMIPGSSRTKTIFFTNNGDSSRTITLKCEKPTGNKDLCRYITFEKSSFTLPLIKGVKTAVDFTINLPEDIDKEDYLNNIVATDDLGNFGVLTVEVDVGTFNFLVGIGTKLVSSRKIGDISVPYFLFTLLVILLSAFGTYYAGLRKLPGGFGISTIISIVFGLGILIVI